MLQEFQVVFLIQIIPELVIIIDSIILPQKNLRSFSKAKIFYNEDLNVIDGTIDKISSKYYIFSKDERNNPLIAQ